MTGQVSRALPTTLAILIACLSAPALYAQDEVPQAPPPSAYLVPPVLLSVPAVAYPDGASGDAIVVLLVTINADGTVRSASATEPREPFDEAAAAAALHWRFEPATRGGTPVAARVHIEVAFHAPGPPPPVAPVPEAEAAPPSRSSTARAVQPDIQEVTVHGARGEPSRTATLSRAEVRQIPGSSATRSARLR